MQYPIVYTHISLVIYLGKIFYYNEDIVGFNKRRLGSISIFVYHLKTPKSKRQYIYLDSRLLLIELRATMKNILKSKANEEKVDRI